MDLFDLEELARRQRDSGRAYLEFLSVPDLSLGIYVLEAGAVDRQQPHTEDEAYVVLAGPRGSRPAPRPRRRAGRDRLRRGRRAAPVPRHHAGRCA